MLKISDDMQMRGNVMARTVIQLILFNERNLMTSFSSLMTLEVESMQFSISKDENLVLGLMSYYGVIEEVFVWSFY